LTASRVRGACAAYVVALFVSSPAPAAQPTIDGATGLLTIPTADVRAEGTADFHYSRHAPDFDRTLLTDVWYGAVGFAPGLEIGARAAADALRRGRRDLSADAKYRLPWTLGGLAFALGVQDAGGHDDLLRRYFAVSTWTWHELTLDLGAGTGNRVMHGAFGGIEWRPWDVLGIVGEYDGSDANAGLKIKLPEASGWRLHMSGAYRGGIEEVEYSVGAEFPLGHRRKRWPEMLAATPPASPQVDSPTSPETSASEPTAPADAQDVETAPPSTVPARVASDDRLRESLQALGFEAVQVGTRATTRVVRLENRRYNHSAADGIGLALGVIAAETAPAVEMIELNLFTYGVPQLSVSAPARLYREFLAAPAATAPALREALQVRQIDRIDDGVTWDDAPRDPLAGVEIVVEPLLRTFVATEYGLLDAALGARGRITAPIGRGWLVNVGAQAGVVQSDDFDSGHNFASTAPDPGLDLALLQYLHTPLPGWTWLWSAGRAQVFRTELDTLALEQSLALAGGRHRLRVKLMAMDAPGSSGGAHSVLLGGYTWFDAPGDYSVSLTAGRFYAGDGGARIDVNRYFGDTIVGLFVKAASADDAAVGGMLSLPLTPRRDMSPGLVQLKGSRSFRHALATTVNDANGRNPLRPLLVYEPMLDLDLSRDFLDSGRLGAEDLHDALPRLHDAYATWAPDATAGR
jgi:hypothetical protein